MQLLLLLASFAGCGYAAGLLIARTDASRFVGTGAVATLGIVALQIDTFALFPLAVLMSFVGAIYGRYRLHQQRFRLYAAGKGGIDLGGQITSSVKPPSGDNTRGTKR